jgi:hypothetical protein
LPSCGDSRTGIRRRLSLLAAFMAD